MTDKKQYHKEWHLKRKERMIAEYNQRRIDDPEWWQRKLQQGREHYAKNKERVDAKHKEYYHKNKVKRIAQTKAERKAHPEWAKKTYARLTQNGYYAMKYKEYREVLSDAYIRALIMDNLAGEDRKKMMPLITPEIIAAERERIRLKRLVLSMKPKSVSPSHVARRERNAKKKLLKPKNHETQASS